MSKKKQAKKRQCKNHKKYFACLPLEPWSTKCWSLAKVPKALYVFSYIKTKIPTFNSTAFNKTWYKSQRHTYFKLANGKTVVSDKQTSGTWLHVLQDAMSQNSYLQKLLIWKQLSTECVDTKTFLDAFLLSLG